MGRKSGSYKFEKRQKELKKQKKKQDKMDRRLNKGGEFDDEPQPSAWERGPLDPDAVPDPDDDQDEDDDS